VSSSNRSIRNKTQHIDHRLNICRRQFFRRPWGCRDAGRASCQTG
jgi:hypothetical protein